MQPVVSPATLSDMEATGGPFSRRTYAITARIDDRIVGVAGCQPLHGQLFVWARLTDELRKRPVWLHKQALKFLAEAKTRGTKALIARADPNTPAARRWLERLGFEPLQDEVFVWIRSKDDVGT